MDIEPPGWVNTAEIFSPQVYLYFYSDFLNPERTRRDADFLEQALEPPEGGRLLDIGCGAGRLANVLASRGYRVTAIDVSTQFLQIAEGDAACLNVTVDYRHQDMRTIGWEGETSRHGSDIPGRVRRGLRVSTCRCSGGPIWPSPAEILPRLFR